MGEVRQRLIGVRHDGAGCYPRQTLYTGDSTALARAEAADPGHAHGVYEYSLEGSGAWYSSPEQAQAAGKGFRS